METNFTTFCNCFLCGQSTTQQKNYKNGSVWKFTFVSCSGITGGGAGGQGGRGAGGQSAPQRLMTGKFLLTYREKRGKEKREKGWKLRRKGEKLEMEAGKRQKKRWGPFFFFFAFHFWKRKKFVLGLPKWEFSTGKKHFTPGKKSGKMTLPPQKNMPVMPLVSCHSCHILKTNRWKSFLYFGNQCSN